MREHIDFTGDTVIVAGGGSGIGRATAEEFANEGATVAIADINEESATATKQSIESTYETDALVVPTDVSSYADCESCIETVLDKFGSVDVLVNTVIATGPNHSTEYFIDESPENWEFEMNVTFHGVLNMAHCALEPMIAANKGVILSTASESYQGQDPGLAVYGSAKAGIVSFTRTLAKEIGEHGVRVNAVSPATTWTPATQDWLEQYGDRVVEEYPLGRLGKPTDHANTFVFLASDAADWITGQTVSVNGGFL